MGRQKITIKDVAAVAEVSLMTVSRALHGKPGVGKELQERIVQLAEEMGYIPNRAAHQLGQGGSSMTVGVVIPHIANTIFPDILQILEGMLSSNGYRILLCCTYNNPIKEFHDISALLERQVDGIIWAPVLMEESRRAAELIRKQKCPLVFLDRKVPGYSADAVLVDDRAGAATMTKHLLRQGFRKIAYLGPRTKSYVAEERYAGFHEAMCEAGAPPRSEWSLSIGSDIDSGRNGVRALLSLPERPEAVFCFNDPLAVGAELELLAQGIEIPGDMALTGFSDSIESEIARVPISSVHQDAVGLGAATAELLLSRMLNPSIRPAPIERIIKTHQIIRASSKRL